MKCSSCGAEIKKGAEFCVVCGKPLPKRKKCPKCGTEVLEDVMFCTNCGNRFEQKPEPVVYYEKDESSNPWKWVAIALVAVLLIGGGAFWYFNQAPQTVPVVVSSDTQDQAESNSDEVQGEEVSRPEGTPSAQDTTANIETYEDPATEGGYENQQYVYSSAYDGFVNIRSSASAKSAILGELHNGGEGAIYLGSYGNWYKVNYNGIIGYCHKDHCHIE